MISEVADEMKAEAIEVLDVRQKTSMADFFLVCSGNSDRMVQAIADRVTERLAERRVKPSRTEGERTGWVLQDYGDVILHVMRDEQRQFYDLESLWKSIRPDPDLD
ncbi:MAG: ribosome silencing factor [Fimbriimonas sp.]